MATRLAELVELVGGQLLGDGELLIDGAATLEVARPGEISLLDAADKLPRLARSHASAVVAPRSVTPNGMATILVDDVRQAFGTLVNHFYPQRVAPRRGVSRAAHVSPTAKLGVNVEIHDGATIDDDVEIGDDCTIYGGARILGGSKIGAGVIIYPNAVLYENTRVGARSIIHAGVSLGAHGFGYNNSSGKHILSAQLGYVEVGTDVEIGANTTIDRGTYGPTVIGDGTKIDNLVMIAHNCRLGKHNLICSQVGIAGSTTTGDYVVMAGQVGVRDHVHIGERSVLGAKAGVAHDVPPGSHMLGVPAIPERETKMNWAILAKLPEMRRQLKALQRTVDLLTGATEQDNAAA